MAIKARFMLMVIIAIVNMGNFAGTILDFALNFIDSILHDAWMIDIGTSNHMYIDLNFLIILYL